MDGCMDKRTKGKKKRTEEKLTKQRLKIEAKETKIKLKRTNQRINKEIKKTGELMYAHGSSTCIMVHPFLRRTVCNVFFAKVSNQ